MNAEFTEKKIVVTTKTVSGETVTTITPAKVRKGLDPKAFVGAEFNSIVAGNLVFAGFVASAASVNDKVTLRVFNTNDQILYDPKTGALTLASVP